MLPIGSDIEAPFGCKQYSVLPNFLPINYVLHKLSR